MRIYGKIVIFFLIQAFLLVEPVGIFNSSYFEDQGKNYADKLSPKLLLNDEAIKSSFSFITQLQKNQLIKKTSKENISHLFSVIIQIARSKYSFLNKERIRLEVGANSMLDKLCSKIAWGRTYFSKEGHVIIIYEKTLLNDDRLLKTICHEVAHVISDDYRFWFPFDKSAQGLVALSWLVVILNKYFPEFIYDTFSINLLPSMWIYCAFFLTSCL
ncbi:hypothetical protein KA005_41820, partial [bacterium]|nr:hypothetical protein [bacterium]